MANQPQPRVVIVTGAGSGIGRSIATMLAKAGNEVALVGRRAGPLQETAGLCEPNATPFPADVSDPDAVTCLVKAVVEKYGRIDALVNNAGHALLVPLGETGPEQTRRIFDVNALAPFFAVEAVWPVMVGQGKASGPYRIVNVSSMATVDPFPGLGAYAAAKGAVNVLARSIRNEGAPHAILGFSVAPGAVETEMLRAIISTDDLPTSAALTPDDVAKVVVACLNGERDGENGETILVPSP